MNTCEILSNRIRGYRAKNNISQEYFALECNVSAKVIGKIERCETNPTINTLDKISNVMGITVSELLKEDIS